MRGFFVPTGRARRFRRGESLRLVGVSPLEEAEDGERADDREKFEDECPR